MAKALAKALDYAYIDSGAMYRAVTLFAMRKGLIKDGHLDEKELIDSLDEIEIDFISKAGVNTTRLNQEEVEKEIRTMEVSSMVSQVSRLAEVREKLRVLQQKAADNKGVVMDGRDIGSAVLPDAELKIFMTADRSVRVRRRFSELIAKGHEITREEVRTNLMKRDKLDTERKENPLVQTPDARLLDNTDLTEKEQLHLALEWATSLIEA